MQQNWRNEMTSDWEYAFFNEDASAWQAEMANRNEADEECMDEDEVWVLHLNLIDEATSQFMDVR